MQQSPRTGVSADHFRSFGNHFRSTTTAYGKGQVLGLSRLGLILCPQLSRKRLISRCHCRQTAEIRSSIALCAAFSVPLKSSTSYKEIIVAWSISVRRNRSCNGLFAAKVMAAGGALEQFMWLLICNQPCYSVSSGLHVSLRLRGFSNCVSMDCILKFPSLL